MWRRKSPTPERLLDAIRALGVARVVAGGVVPLPDGAGAGFVVNLSLDPDDLRLDPRAAVATFRERAGRVAARLRDSGARYDRYACQFVPEGGGARIYASDFNARLELTGERADLDALADALR